MKTSEVKSNVAFTSVHASKVFKKKYPGIVEQLNQVAEFKQPRIKLGATCETVSINGRGVNTTLGFEPEVGEHVKGVPRKKIEVTFENLVKRLTELFVKK